MAEPKIVHEWTSEGMPGSPDPPLKWAVTEGGMFYADHGSGYEFINITKSSKELARLAKLYRAAKDVIRDWEESYPGSEQTIADGKLAELEAEAGRG